MPKLGRGTTIICRLLLPGHGPINIYSHLPGVEPFVQTSVGARDGREYDLAIVAASGRDIERF